MKDTVTIFKLLYNYIVSYAEYNYIIIILYLIFFIISIINENKLPGVSRVITNLPAHRTSLTIP